jgi:hypothetical protein
LKKQDLDKELNQEWLEDRRLELSGLLGQFIKQETEREHMAQELVIQMENQREQDQATFWLVQFQVKIRSHIFFKFAVTAMQYARRVSRHVGLKNSSNLFTS